MNFLIVLLLGSDSIQCPLVAAEVWTVRRRPPFGRIYVPKTITFDKIFFFKFVCNFFSDARPTFLSQSSKFSLCCFNRVSFHQEWHEKLGEMRNISTKRREFDTRSTSLVCTLCSQSFRTVRYVFPVFPMFASLSRYFLSSIVFR